MTLYVRDRMLCYVDFYYRVPDKDSDGNPVEDALDSFCQYGPEEEIGIFIGDSSSLFDGETSEVCFSEIPDNLIKTG